MAIYMRIKELREAKGMTQFQLAQAVGIQPTSIQKIEYQNNKSIPNSTIEALCKALDCLPGDLFELR